MVQSIKPVIEELDVAEGTLVHYHFDRRVFAKRIQNKWVYSFSIEDLIDGTSILDDSVIFCRAFGFVYPPYTIYADVFLVPPGTAFFPGDIIKLYGIEIAGTDYVAPESMVETVRHRLNSKIASLAEGNLAPVCLFSGGIDSSVLLGLLSSNAIVSRCRALMCEMPSMPAENDKAIKMTKERGIEFNLRQVELGSRVVLEEVVEKIREPIFDEAGLLLLGLIRNNSFLDNDEIFIDGQGADSLFFGLPHNRVATIYINYPTVRRIARMLDIMPDFISRASYWSRKLYRVRKAIGLLSSESLEQFLQKSLLLPGQNLTSVRSNVVLKSMTLDMSNVANQVRNDPQEFIRRIFMLRVLPARELQKYNVLDKYSIKVSLPFLDSEFVKEMMGYSSQNFIVKGNYKYPLHMLSKSLWPGYFAKYYTSPFYVNTDRNRDESLLEESLRVLRQV